MTSSPYPLEARDGNLGVVTCRHLQLRPERSLVGALNEAQLRRKTGAEAVERRAIPAGIFGESARSATRISSQADPGFAGIARSRWRGGHSVCDRARKGRAFRGLAADFREVASATAPPHGRDRFADDRDAGGCPAGAGGCDRGRHRRPDHTR